MRVSARHLIPAVLSMASTAISSRTVSSLAAVSAAGEASTVAPAARIEPRRSKERGHADHGWLDSYHTFSFASYHDPRYGGFGPLRVINEDRVAASEGFPTHGHREYVIYSYLLSGALRHTDSMGHDETVTRGQIQLTSAGTGISHSEFNASKRDLVHFLQIWMRPDTRGLKPRYATQTFTDEEKKNQLRLILSGDARDGSMKLDLDADVYASILEGGAEVTHTFRRKAGYIHVADVPGTSGIEVNGVALAPGDGAFIRDADSVHIRGLVDADTAAKRSAAIDHPVIRGLQDYGATPGSEFLLFDLPMTDS